LDLPTLDTGLAWDTSNLYQYGTILVVPVPEPAISVLLVSALGAMLSCKIVRRRVRIRSDLNL
jgi:hypothetical protein